MSKGITLCFSLHQPYRIRNYSIFDVTYDHEYSHHAGDSGSDKEIFTKIADRSYRPMLQLLLTQLTTYSQMSFSLSISGTWLEQAAAYCPDLLDMLHRLVDTGRVEMVNTPYYRSLAHQYSPSELHDELIQHQKKLKDIFQLDSTVVALTNFDTSPEAIEWAAGNQYKSFVHFVDTGSSSQKYTNPSSHTLTVLGGSRQLSDDITYRFSQRGWNEWPLTAEKFCGWLEAADAETTHLLLPLEGFGELNRSDSGIFNFWDQFITLWASYHGRTLSSLSRAPRPKDVHTLLPSSHYEMTDFQREITTTLYAIEPHVRTSSDEKLIRDWQRLLSSDIIDRLNPQSRFHTHTSHYDEFISLHNIIRDILWRIYHPVSSREEDNHG